MGVRNDCSAFGRGPIRMGGPLMRLMAERRVRGLPGVSPEEARQSEQHTSGQRADKRPCCTIANAKFFSVSALYAIWAQERDIDSAGPYTSTYSRLFRVSGKVLRFSYSLSHTEHSNSISDSQLNPPTVASAFLCSEEEPGSSQQGGLLRVSMEMPADTRAKSETCSDILSLYSTIEAGRTRPDTTE